MENEPRMLEREAQAELAQEKFSEAYGLFKKAGEAYRQNKRHKEAALCLASAASCWAIKSGEKIFHNASLVYEEAAQEAELAGDLQYASLLYRQAAINFERDMEFLSFSDCFYSSKECLRKFLNQSLFTPQKIRHISALGLKKKEAGTLKKLFLCLSLTFSALIWGHGERPNRTLYLALSFIFVASLFYMHNYLLRGSSIFKPNFLQAFYFSTITFTTVGYGDIAPIGFSKAVAMFEVFCGVFIIPIFIVGLSRKYLRT